ncbi:MAG: type VI secretion system contractile sheath large subunit [Gammaproteobacteria bacterium]|nr:type VI secretion system contractile sheath large subunit [Gammaproteobacteria bacterium]
MASQSVMVMEQDRLMWDRIELSYSDDSNGEQREVVLPFRILAMANFSGKEAGDDTTPLVTHTVTAESVESLLKALQITFSFTFPVGQKSIDASLVIEQFSDFLPQSLITRVKPLRQLSEVISLLERQEQSDFSTQPEWLQQHLLQCGVNSSEPLPRLVSISLLRTTLQQLLNRVLHQPRFIELETLWRDLLVIVTALKGKSALLDILDIHYDRLRDDCGTGQEVFSSQLYHLLYNIEYGQFGGVPYSVAVLGFSFGPKRHQIRLLQQLAAIGSRCFLPFIAQASPAFFQVNSFRDLSTSRGLRELHQGPSFIHWRGFQQQENSRYIALTLPGVLRRLPYHSQTQSGTAFDEEIKSDARQMIWGSAAFDYVVCLLESYEKYGSAIDAVGPVGGRCPRPQQLNSNDHYRYPFVDLRISEARESELADLGFMPLVLNGGGDAAHFHSANSIHWGGLGGLSGDQEAVLDRRLNAQLPYLLLVTRVAHYLKVIERDRLGGLTTPAEVVSQLNHWLQQYVSDVDNPVAAVRARRPFRAAAVTLMGSDDSQQHTLQLQLVPHLKIVGARFSLSLQGTI